MIQTVTSSIWWPFSSVGLMKGVINPSVEQRGEARAERSPQMRHIRMCISSSDVGPQEDRKH